MEHRRNLREALVDLGLGSVQAQTYVELIRAGPVGASELARSLEVPRTEMYRRLESLVGEGLAARTLTRPARFQAARPHELFDHLERRHAMGLESVRRAREELGPQLERATPAGAASAATRGFRVLRGRRSIQLLLARMLEQARDDVRWADTRPRAAVLGTRHGLWDLIGTHHAADPERFRARVLLRDCVEARRSLSALPVEDLEVRLLPLERLLCFAVTDRREVLQYTPDGNGNHGTGNGQGRLPEEETGVWTDAPPFVEAQAAYFEVLWERAVPAPRPTV